jgi:hypothetical protein
MPHVKEEQWTFVIQFYMDHCGIPQLDKASINEIYYEEVPVKTPTTTTTTTTTQNTEQNKAEQSAEQKTEQPKPEEKKTEKVKKEKNTICIIKLAEILYGLPQSYLDNIIQKEANQENEDRLFHLAINKRNEIENFIYSTRSKLDSDLSPFITNEEKQSLINLMNEMETWLYSGDEAIYDKSVLEARGKNLNELGTKVYKRYHDWGRLSESLNNLENSINGNINRLNTEFEKKKTNSSILTQKDFEELQKIINNYNNLLNESRTQFGTHPKFTDTPIRYEDIDKATEELNKVKYYLI